MRALLAGLVALAVLVLADLGLALLTKSLADAWGPEGIRVNGLAPGFVATKITAVSYDNPEINEGIINTTPLRRWGTPVSLGFAAKDHVDLGADSGHGSRALGAEEAIYEGGPVDPESVILLEILYYQTLTYVTPAHGNVMLRIGIPISMIAGWLLLRRRSQRASLA